MTAVGVYEDLLSTVRERLARARGVAEVDDLEVRRSLNELTAEMRGGRSFEEAFALAARPVDDLGAEDPPVAASQPTLPKPRPVLVGAAVSDEARQARQRALFEERRRRAEAARPAPKPMPPKVPIPLVAAVTVAELGVQVLDLLRRGPASAYDLALKLQDDPSPHDVGVALWSLEGRGLVEQFGRGKSVIWRLVAKGAPS